jgi:enoyl-CoA hydratase/carnithine racemase
MSILTQVSSKNAILEVILDRSPSNLLRLEDLKALSQIFLDCGKKDSQVRSLVIKSKIPNIFSMGLDPFELLPLTPKEREGHFQALCEMMINALHSAVPIITVVNGPAMAGGAVLAALGNHRYFNSQFGKFSFSESKVNLPVPGFVQALVQRNIGSQHLFDILVMAKNYDAKSALQCGFASDTYENEVELDEKISDLTAKIFRLSKEVIQATLRVGNKETLDFSKEFLKDSSSFNAFLGNDFFGKGLEAVVKSMTSPSKT